MRTSRELIFGLGLAAVGLVAFAGAASAQVINTDVGLNDAFSQTSDSTATETGAFFSARVFFSGPGQYTTGTLTLPNSNTRPLADQGYLPPTYEIGYEDTAASLSDLEATYPTGTYTFDVSGGTQPEKVVSQSYAGDAYPNTPLVTNFSALQGLNAADAFTVDLNGMVVSPNATPDVNNIYFTPDRRPSPILSSPAEPWLQARVTISIWCMTTASLIRPGATPRSRSPSSTT